MSDHTPETQDEVSDVLSERQLLLQDIGEKLSQARHAKHEPLSKAVRHLKIPINLMQALESGHWESLPDDVYVVGFLRQYSNYLDIDLSNEINHLKNNDYTLTRPLTFPDPPVAPSRRWAWLTGSAFVLLFIIFNIISGNDEAQSPVMVNDAGYVIEQTRTQNTASIENTKAEQSSHDLSNKTGSETKQALTSTSKAIDATAMPPHQQEPKPTTPTASATLGINTSPSHQTQNKKSLHSFRFEAVTAPVWLQLFAPNKAGNGKGRLLKEILLKQAQHATIRQRTESLWITCGNALALRIRVDQKILVKTGKLGNGKKVLRDFHFNLNDY
ncbi:MAG: helix-turn-helix domain-containing protein [Mariprofundus sp.]|nr:helix-turn-helix domain-containing protein [Mariprofundus sp.]